MDLEMKKVKREDLIEGETMTGAEEEKYVSWLKEHFHLAMVDAVFTYDQPEIDVSEDFLKNLARTYVLPLRISAKPCVVQVLMLSWFMLSLFSGPYCMAKWTRTTIQWTTSNSCRGVAPTSSLFIS